MANEMITKLATLFMNQEATDGTAAAGVAGDAILARDINVDGGPEMNTREYQGLPGQLGAVPGAKSASLSFTTELKGNGTTTIPEPDEILTGCFGTVVAADLDSTISGAAGSTTVWDVLAATNGTVGNMVMLETGTADTYECAGPIKVVDTGAAPDDLTVALAAVNGGYATDGKKVKEMRTWQIKLPPPAVNSLTADVYRSAVGGGADRLDRIVGCRGDFSMSSPAAGQIPAWAFKFEGWSVSRVTTGTRPTPTYDTANPKAAIAQIFRVDGTYTNAFDIEISLGASLAVKKSQNADGGTYGVLHVSYTPKFKFKIHPAYTSVSYFTDWEAGTPHTLLFQVGNALYGTWAFYGPRAVFDKVSQPSDNGVDCWEVEGHFAEQNDASPTSATLDAALYLGLG